jgi:hypothetical protein
MSRRSWIAGVSLLTLVLLVACGTKDRGGFDTDVAPAAAGEGGPAAPGSPEGGGGDGSPGVGYPDGGCSPLTCTSGCCGSNGACLPGTAPAQCGKGGLVCVDCSAVGYGCVDQGCNAAATCTGCDGCCKAGTCNPNGKTQDNACGRGGAICKDCTSSSQACDGNGNCH